MMAQKRPEQKLRPVKGWGNDRLRREKEIARLFQRAGDGALLPGGEMRVLARQDLAGVGDIAAHHLRCSERIVLGDEALRPLFGGGAHENRKGHGAVRTRVVNPHFFVQNPV